MKKVKNFLLSILLIFPLLLSGCAFLPTLGGFNSDDNESSETIDTFEFVTDAKMTVKKASSDEYYNLVLYAGEDYQIKTTIDDALGDDYYLIYKTDDEINGKFTLSETGYIQTEAALQETETFVIDVDLYKKGTYKRVAREYFILSLRVGEYANIILTNDNLEYDDNTSTYSMTMDSGNDYSITYSVAYNTAHVVTFSLREASYADFMSVDSEGNISTTKTKEDQVGEISIRVNGANGILDVVFLKIKLNKSEDFKDEFKIINQSNAKEVQNGDALNLYNGHTLSFDVKYNNQSKTNVITVSDPTVLEVDGATNTIKALKLGTSEVTFAYEAEQITVTVNVIKDKLLSIAAENEGGSFIILNDTVYYLDKMYATYQSTERKEISDTALIIASISDKDEVYKTVAFTYVEDGELATVTYDVKFYAVSDYDGQTTAYDNNDYFKNYYIGAVHSLPNKGRIKLLAIPVWFNDSDLFFTQAQKAQIIEDIAYTVNGNRPNSELKSVKQYYEAQSYGAITMDITVSDEFYCSSTSYQDYTDCNNYKVTNTHVLGTNAIDWYFTNHTDEKLEDYDLNGDGYLDGLLLYYGANYYGAVNDENKSTAFEVNNNDNSLYSFNTLSFCPIGGLYGLKKKAPAEQLTVLDLSATYSNAFRESSRTMIHEIGHMFGNVDLYEDQFAAERFKPAGGFSMQEDDYGTFDPYHVNRIGWSKPQIYASNDYQLGDKITLRLSDFQSSGQNVILTNTWNASNSLYDEYLILELFAPTGINEFDAKINFMNMRYSGVRVWHVNSLLTDIHDSENKTSTIIDGKQYNLAYSNYDVESEFDVLHMIRNNPNEAYHTTSRLQYGKTLFTQGDSFDMETFKSQFINGSKLDNGEKLGWSFTVEAIYCKADGTYEAIVTLERTDNVRTEFSQKVVLNRSDLDEPTGEEEYGEEIFGADGEFSLVYKYVTPPSFYEQGYPISEKGMCLFASSDGNGGYIDLTIKEIDGKEVCINSISITYSYLTDVTPTVLVGGTQIEGQEFEPQNEEAYGFKYAVNGASVRIQNQYDGTINHWSILALYEITIDYTIK